MRRNPTIAIRIIDQHMVEDPIIGYYKNIWML